MPNLVEEYKIIFSEKEAKLETLQKLAPSMEVSYKFVLNLSKA